MSTVERTSEHPMDPGEILSGLIWIGVGVTVWLYQAGRVDGLDIATFWPVAMVLGGVAELIARPPRRGRGGVILLAVGGFLLVNNLGYASWPLFLIAVGAVLVWRGWRDDATVGRATNRKAEVGHDR